MARLGRTIANLARHRRGMAAPGPAAGTPLEEVASFGDNPGDLRLLIHVPKVLAPSPALVVVLHGCTQTAAGYDLGTGWSDLAERHGFVAIFPEQTTANNPKACFSWFQPGDTTRGQGEAASIRAMVGFAQARYGIDPARIFVTGLSAGGAMASVMLATYPEVFAAGAIVAGLPYGAAAGVPQAFEAMFNPAPRPARAWGDLVRNASPHRGPWPRVSVWHGDADATVVPANADEIVKQWADVHGITLANPEEGREGPVRRRIWRDRAGAAAIESFSIPGLAHGTPIATTGEETCGRAGPFLLEAGISSTHHIARFFGLLEARPEAAARPQAESAAPPRAEAPERAPQVPPVVIPPAPPRPALPAPGMAAFTGSKPGAGGGARPHRPGGIDVEAVITGALRKAGLMR